MNTVKAGAKYVGEGTTEHGIRFTEVTVSAVGKGEDIKLRVLSTKAGGDTLGMKNANVDVIGYVEYNKDSIDTHEVNFPDCKLIGEDIRKIPIEIKTILAEAKPCMPSIKFIAFIIPTEAKTVKKIPIMGNCKK